MTATKTKLADLHERLTDAMSEALDAEVERIAFTSKLYEADLTELDEDTAKQISNAITLAPAARVDNGLLKTVSSFLKDNSITADLTDGTEEDAVDQKLRELATKRRAASTPLDGIMN